MAEGIGGLIFIVLVLTTLAILIGLWKFIWRSMTGGYKTLDRIDDGRDNENKAIILNQGAVAELGRSHFADLKDETCGLHQRSFIGYVQFQFFHITNVIQTVEKGQVLCIAACSKCAEIALAKRRYVWGRENRAEHSIEFSTQLLPFLQAGRYAYIEKPFIAFDVSEAIEVSKNWITSDSPDARACGVLSLAYRKSDQTIDMLKNLLNDKGRSKAVKGGVFELVSEKKVAELARSQLSEWGLSRDEIAAKART